MTPSDALSNLRLKYTHYSNTKFYDLWRSYLCLGKSWL